MSITGWLSERRTRLIPVSVPAPLYHALKTVTHMQNTARADNATVTEGDVITLALTEYLQRNLWTNVVEDYTVEVRPQRAERAFKPLPPSVPSSVRRIR